MLDATELSSKTLLCSSVLSGIVFSVPVCSITSILHTLPVPMRQPEACH